MNTEHPFNDLNKLEIWKNSDLEYKTIDGYVNYLIKHVNAVVTVGIAIGIDKKQLLLHDLSKISQEEFEPYAIKFFGNGDSPLFKYAWQHHLVSNPHHWNHWVLDGGQRVAVMPYNFMLEMIADWHGAEYAQSGQLDISNWYNKNINNIRLHPTTRTSIMRKLIDLGYEFDRKYTLVSKDLTYLHSLV